MFNNVKLNIAQIVKIQPTATYSASSGEATFEDGQAPRLASSSLTRPYWRAEHFHCAASVIDFLGFL